MRTPLTILLFSLALTLAAQTVQTATVTTSVPPPSDYAITLREQHCRVWSRTEWELAPGGQLVPRIHSYTELAAGICHLAGAEWVDSSPELQVTATGAQSANSSHSVALLGNLNTAGAVTVTTVDGKRLVSNILGLSYADASGKSVVIAQLQDSYGQLLPSGNEGLYPNAFTGSGITADVLYVNSIAGLEQLVLLRTQLPPPGKWGLDPATTVLQVTTDFGTDTPAPVLSPQTVDGAPDSLVNFGSMSMGPGYAFALGSQANKVRVTKRWFVLDDGHNYLVEQVPLKELDPFLAQLAPPAPGSAALPASHSSAVHLAAGHPVPPSVKLASRSTPSFKRAPVTPPGKAFAIDYTLLSSQPAITLAGDSTYYLSGTVNVSSNLTILGNTVVKVAKSSSATLAVSGTVTVNAGMYKPAVFTAVDDNSVGQAFGSGTPSGYYGGVVLNFSAASSIPTLSDLRFCYLSNCLALPSSSTIADAQFLKCFSVVNNANGSFLLKNVLCANTGGFQNQPCQSCSGITLTAENVTVDNSTNFLANPSASTVSLTNCLFANVANWQASGTTLNTNSCAFLASDAGVFQPCGLGSFYLATNSPYRGIATTNIDAGLLTDLRLRTTYPPILYSNVTFTNAITFPPQAQRETGPPDLGYGYDPLDYLFGGCTANANLAFSSAAVGWFRTSQGWYHAGHGIHIGDTYSVSFNGTASAPCYWVRWTTVQEGLPGYSEPAYGPGGITGWTPASTSFALAPLANLRFTKCSILAWEADHMRDDNGYLIVHARDSEFWGGGCNGYCSQLNYTNVLFDDVSVWTSWNGVPSTNCTFIQQNCLMHGGMLSLGRSAPDSYGNYPLWSIHDTAFDATSLTVNDAANGNSAWTAFNYNAYLTGANTNLPSGPNDLTVTNFNWQSGWLGNYYQLTNSPLINTGSMTANLLGLYHYTVTTNPDANGLEIKETNSIVDIGYHRVATDANGNPIDTDGDGIPDYVEDANGNGVVDPGETDWTDYYNGVLPVLTIVSGNNQFGSPSNFLALPLVVSVASTNGAALSNAPITFAVAQGGVQLALATNGMLSTNLTLRTDGNGHASVFAQMPSNSVTTAYITATATSGNNTTQVTFTATTIQGAIMWLRADAGITNTTISYWADQTTNHNNATQSTPANQPVLVTNAAFPVVHFNGTNEAFYLPSSMLTGTTQAETLLVLRVGTNVPAGPTILWRLGGGGGTFYPNSSGQIADDFGSTVRNNIGVPAQSLYQYHVYNVAAQNGNWQAWINGVLQGNSTANTYAVFWSNLGLGWDAYYTGGSFFSGDIAEVIVFSRTLTSAERLAANQYLNGKYALVPVAPAAPTNLVAQAISPTQVSLTWSEVLNQGATQISIERKTATGGTYAMVAQVSDATSYIDTNLTAGATYYYRVRASNLGTWSAYSNEAQTTTPTAGPDLPLANMLLWLKADSGIAELGSNAPVDFWADQSGQRNHATQATAANQPTWMAGTSNSYSVVHFNGTNEAFYVPSSTLAGTTQAEALLVLRVGTNIPAGPTILWRLGGGGGTFYPSSSGQIADDFGSAVRNNIAAPAQSLYQYHVYNVAAQNGNWQAWINGVLQGSSTANTYTVFWSTLGLGWDAYYTGGSFFCGDIAEVIIFNRTLTSAERLAANQYLNGKYGLVPAVPPAPTNLVAQAISPTQVSLTWSEVLNQGATQISIERKTGTGGTYAAVALVSDATSYIDTNLTAGTTYYYRMRASNLGTWSAYSNEAQATTPATGSDLPLASLAVWLKADSGLAEIGSSSPVNFWVDQSGHANNASQQNSGNEPLWVAGALNGYPVVRFNGTSASLSMANFLTGTTQAEVLVVLKAATNLPAANSMLWRMGLNYDNVAYPNTSGQIVENFGSTSSATIGPPLQSLTQYHLYQVGAANGSWMAWINGVLQLGSQVNTYGVLGVTSLNLGRDSYPYYGPSYFGGDIAELLIFNRMLTADERATAGTYLVSKYGLAQYATNSTTPTAPTNLVAVGLAPGQLNLTWNRTSTNESGFRIERKPGTNGVYQTIGSTLAGVTNFVDATAVPANTYVYRVKAENYFGQSGYSPEISPPAIGFTWPPLDLTLTTVGANNPLTVAATDVFGTVTNVTFFVQGTFIGSRNSTPFSTNWVAPLTLTYQLTSKAADSLGNSQWSSPTRLTVFPDTDGDGIGDCFEVGAGTDPTSSGDPPPPPPNDHTAPTIYLTLPTGATPLP